MEAVVIQTAVRFPLLLSLLALGDGGTGHAPIVPVTATDYALQAPDTVRAGRLELAFENRGRVAHEVAVGLLRPGAGNREMIAAGQAGLRLRDAPEHYLAGAPFGVLFAWPGRTSPAHLTIEARRGQRYALFCTFRDSVKAPEHAAMGMVHVLEVR
jgi:hypothetical protein